ncbi:VOC family protein [Streptomyces sp. NPDC047315]|uniref:VOC family protein n=1 Tax=Streptomyces sp. NPDC047315 TaxID=3155142 RepID=UPI0033FC58D6
MPPRLTLATVVLDCADAHALADFYRGLLGWEVRAGEPEWVLIQAPGGEGIRLALQGERDYVPPVWPEEPGAQQKMLHIDIRVDDLTAAVGHAVALGAREAAHQPQGDVRVLFDPAGHPFCLFVDA